MLGTLLFCGCARILPAPQVSCNARETLERLHLRNARIHSFLGVGDAVLTMPTAEHHARVVLAFLKPRYALLRLSTPANAPLLFLSVQSKKIRILDFVHHTVHLESLQENRIHLPWGGIDLPLTPFLSAWAGNVEPIPHAFAQCRESPTDHRRVLLLSGTRPEAPTQRITLDPKQERPTAVELRKGGSPEFRVTFSGSLSQGDTTVPRVVTIEIPGRFVRIRLKYRQVRINPELSPEQFRLPIPENFTSRTRK